MTSDSYTREGLPTWDGLPTRDNLPTRDGLPTRDSLPSRGGRERRTGAGFAVVAVLSVAATAALLIAAVVYYLGSPGRIASDYTSVASPANQAMRTELASYTKNRYSGNLAAAESDLTREARTISSFNVLLETVTFPRAAASASQSLIFADDKLHKLIQAQARSHTLGEMQGLEAGANAAAVNVKIKVARIRAALGLPPGSGPLY